MNPAPHPSPEIDQAAAAALLADLEAAPTVARIAEAARRLRPHRESLTRTAARVACVSSFTFDPIVPSLELQGLRAGIAIEPYVAPFAQYERELIDASSGLNSFQPDVVILAVRLQDVGPDLYEGFNALSADAATRVIDERIERLGSALATFRGRSKAHILIQNYDQPAVPALGIADRGGPGTQSAAIARANRALGDLANSLDNIRVMDYDALVARHGRAGWTDPRLALFARIPVAPRHHWVLAGFYVRHLRPLYGLTRKVLALDADHTLWGGVVGDVGIDGIALGPDYPGNAYVAFQKRVLDLHHRGVILCLASKNEPGIVEEVFARHPGMVLRPDHIAAMRVNWNPKPDNLRELADDLNLGLDSFVFVDDSPVECEMMRTSLPEVMTVRLPSEPAEYARVIESLDCFDQWAVSAEDRRRSKLYRADTHRRRARAAAIDLPTFYRGLTMRISFFVDNPAHVARAAQMTNRTNQFNMNTVRCTEDDIRRFMDADDHHVVTLVLLDRFGDNGVVGLAVVRRGQGAWILPLMLMSCRVLGRTVEQTFVGWIAEQARAAGARQLIGEVVPTAKNKPFAGFYESLGFVAGPACEGRQQWTWSLDHAETTAPDWFEIDVKRPEHSAR